MSSTNKTTYYELPQFIGSDIPTWLGDFNGAMSDIDTALKSNADRADLASQNASNAVNTANSASEAVGTLNTAVAGLTSRVGTCEQTDATQSQQITALQGTASNLDNRVTALEQGGGGGGTNYYIATVDLGHFSGSGFSNLTEMDCATDAQLNMISQAMVTGGFIGVTVEITDENGHGSCEVKDITGSFDNAFSVTVPMLKRVYANRSVPLKFVQMNLGTCSGGKRSVTYVSSVSIPITAGSGSSGNGTLGTPTYNTNGITDATSVDIKITGKVLCHD